MVYMSIASFKIKKNFQISSYKQDTDFGILCFVNKAQDLLLFTHVLYWYEFQLNGAFFC